MPKGQKQHPNGSYVRTILCPECDKRYRSNNVRMVNKLMIVHMKTAHNSTIRGQVEKKQLKNAYVHRSCYGADHGNKSREIMEEQLRDKTLQIRRLMGK